MYPMRSGQGVATIGVIVFLLRYEPPAADADLARTWPRCRPLVLRIVSGSMLPWRAWADRGFGGRGRRLRLGRRASCCADRRDVAGPVEP